MRPPRTAVATGTLAVIAAGVLAGCGSSGVGQTARSSTAARADGPTTTTTAADAPPAVHVSKKVRAEEASLHRAVSSALRAGRASRVTYGGVPEYLRSRQRPPANQVLNARPGHPAEPITGVGVRMRLATGGSALALGVGPYVPLHDQGSFRNHTSATWRVTFTDVHGTVPLRASMFLLTDEQGRTLIPKVSVLGGGPLPRTAPRGRTLTVVLAARTSIGSGTLYYTPSGRHFLAAWDFDAETD